MPDKRNADVVLSRKNVLNKRRAGHSHEECKYTRKYKGGHCKEKPCINKPRTISINFLIGEIHENTLISKGYNYNRICGKGVVKSLSTSTPQSSIVCI